MDDAFTPAPPICKVLFFRGEIEDAARANGLLPPEVSAHLKLIIEQVIEQGTSPRADAAWVLWRAHLELRDAEAGGGRP